MRETKADNSQVQMPETVWPKHMHETESYLFVMCETNIPDLKKLRDKNQMGMINVIKTILEVNQEQWKLFFLQMRPCFMTSQFLFSTLWSPAYFFTRMKNKQIKNQKNPALLCLPTPHFQFF